MTANTESRAQSETTLAQPQRRYDIDWLRVLAVLLLFFYHPARIFYVWDPFYVKNGQLSRALSYLLVFIDRWHMPLLFLLAGASTWFALRRRSGGQYAKERFLRLLVPLIVGLLIMIPPQIYFDLLHHNPGYGESYLQFYPRFFSGNPEGLEAYKGGFDMGHLWFIFELFLFSLIALPLFLYLRNEAGERLIGRLAAFFARPGTIFLFFIPIYLMELTPIGYPNPLYFITFFICGYLLVADARFGEAIDRYKGLALVIGPAIYAIWLGLVFLLDLDTPRWVWEPVNAHRSFVTWCSLIALSGYGRKLLNSPSRFLSYFGEASYPLYILHQTFVIGIAYYVVQWDAGVLVKLASIIVGSFVATMVLYDLLVKRTSATRVLLGMRPLKK
jgi:glucan biosynthesis protein C